jgi:hypothetical protein
MLTAAENSARDKQLFIRACGKGVCSARAYMLLELICGLSIISISFPQKKMFISDLKHFYNVGVMEHNKVTLLTGFHRQWLQCHLIG